jgi:crotonyl-CoA reductase
LKEILDAILSSDSQAADFAALPLPEAYRAVTLHRDEEHMFDGIDVKRVHVPGDAGEIDDVGFGNRPGQRGFIANLDVLVG